MLYILLFTVLLIAELAYFKLADRFNIIDKPNERSSHSRVTLRGGGVIFYAGALAFFVWSGFTYPWFFAGLSLIAAVSFVDDVAGVSNRIRLTIHLLAVSLLFGELGMFDQPWWLVAMALVVTIGTINAYNFMDGINGITGGYSLVVLGALWYVNAFVVPFAAGELIVFSMLALVVFNIFNFREKARCFAGDVGAVSVAFIVIFLLGSLMLEAGNPVYILFLGVYGVDSVLTIIRRLLKRENIFEAHRSHLYQLMANEGGIPHTRVSLYYMAAQAGVCAAVILMAGLDPAPQLAAAFSTLAGLSVVYVVMKRRYLSAAVPEM